MIEIQGPYHFKLVKYLIISSFSFNNFSRINNKKEDVGYSHMVKNILRNMGYAVIEIGQDITKSLSIRNFS